MNTWAMRIKSRMKELGMTQDELANKLGITRGAVTHYIAGRRVPPLKQFQKLAAILKADPAWLQFGTTDASIAEDAAVSENKPDRLSIPILPWDQTAELTNITKIKRKDIKEWLPHFYTEKAHWYALRVKGDTMAAPIGHSKSFNEGNIIIVDPDKKAEHGDFVVALLPHAKEATFKQYVNDGDTYYLKPLNPQYPLTKFEKSTFICGVVVSCIIDYIGTM